MQEKSEEKYSPKNRLEKLRLVKGWTWFDVASALKTSESMIYAILAGRRLLGPKIDYRLKLVEGEVGIRYAEEQVLTQIAAGTALARKRGDPAAVGAILHDILGPAKAEHEEKEIWRERALAAEKKLAELRTGMRELLDRSAATPQEQAGKTGRLETEK
ncbi:MAG: hypothetical protein ABFD89_05260 [Bryobacteraceae bacterium]